MPKLFGSVQVRQNKIGLRKYIGICEMTQVLP